MLNPTLPDKTEYFIAIVALRIRLYYEDPAGSGSTIESTVYGPPALSKIVEPSGNIIIINTNSIFHQIPATISVMSLTSAATARNGIIAISDPDAGTNGLPLVQYVYDQDDGNLVQVLKLQNRASGLYATNHYDYNNPNYPHLITSIENAIGAPITRDSYDSSGRLTQMQDANGNLTQYVYAATNLEMIVDPLGRTNTFSYDSSGNIIAQTNALNQVTLMAYDANNNKTNQVVFANGQPYATNNYAHDPETLLLAGSTDLPGDTTWGFSYNGFGEALTSSTRAETQRIVCMTPMANSPVRWTP